MHLKSAQTLYLQERRIAGIDPAARLVALGLLLAAAGCQAWRRFPLPHDHPPAAYDEATFARKSFASFKITARNGTPWTR